MTGLRPGDPVLADLSENPRRGVVCETAGPWWDRWYGVKFTGFGGSTTTYYYKRRDLIRLTVPKDG